MARCSTEVSNGRCVFCRRISMMTWLLGRKSCSNRPAAAEAPACAICMHWSHPARSSCSPKSQTAPHNMSPGASQHHSPCVLAAMRAAATASLGSAADASASASRPSGCSQRAGSPAGWACKVSEFITNESDESAAGRAGRA